MNGWADTWLLSLIVMTGGAAAGYWVASRRHKNENDRTDGEVDVEELLVRKESLIAQLRELREQREIIPEGEYANQKAELERAAADILRQVEETLARRSAKKAKRAPAQPGFWERSGQLKGILIGAGAVSALWLIFPAFVNSSAPTTSARPTRGAPQATGEPAGSGDPEAERMAAETEAIMARVHENPDDVEAVKRGGALFLSQGRVEAAAMMVQRAQGLAPMDPEVRLQWATLLAMRGEDETSTAAVEALLHDHPEMADAWYLHGMLIMRGGEIDRARASFTQFVSRAPEGPRKTRVQAILSAGAGTPAPGRNAP